MNERSRDESAEEVEYIYLTVENILDLFADRFGCSFTDAADQLRNKDGLAMLTFLDINDVTLSGPDDRELAGWILDLSNGLTTEALANRIRAFLGAS
jgi:hypothetical protein